MASISASNVTSHHPTGEYTTIYGTSLEDGIRSEHRFELCSCGEALTPVHKDEVRRIAEEEHKG